LGRAGVAFVPSGRRVFGGLTVRQNLELARRDGQRRKGGEWTLERVMELFPALVPLGDRRAQFLSGGEQQMLKLSRALLCNPRILLLDEPTEGLAPVVVQEMGQWLAELRKQRFGILLAEQNALLALRLADRGYILEKGRIQLEAPASGLLENEESLAYLGVARR
jgi:branched-chain amino acid transport system ATP-binding protein